MRQLLGPKKFSPGAVVVLLMMDSSDDKHEDSTQMIE